MFNIQNFNNLITIKEVDNDNPFLIYLEHVITKEGKPENPTITTGLLSRNLEDDENWSEISIVPTKKSIELKDNLSNYTEKEFKKLIINKIKEQAIININSNDYPEKLKTFSLKTQLEANPQVDIKTKSQKEIHDMIERYIVSKIHNCSNLIAVNSRIGPANTLIMHHDCYKEFEIFKTHFSNYNTVINNTIDKKEVLIYRLEPQIESSGILLVYNKTNDNFSIETFLTSSPKYFSILNVDVKFKKEIREEKLKNLITK